MASESANAKKCESNIQIEQLFQFILILKLFYGRSNGSLSA